MNDPSMLDERMSALIAEATRAAAETCIHLDFLADEDKEAWRLAHDLLTCLQSVDQI